MATKLENKMSEKGIKTFGAAVSDDASVMMKTLSIRVGNIPTAVYICAAHTLHLLIGDIR
jgi:hypothetical protein